MTGVLGTIAPDSITRSRLKLGLLQTYLYPVRLSSVRMAETSIYVVKTTANQERSVANLIAQLARKEKYDITALLVPDVLKGYVLVEAKAPEIVEEAIQGVPHARSVIKGASSFGEVEHFLTPKPAVVGINEGAIVELISGPFKGEMARVKRVDVAKEEITVELFEAMVPIPITVRGDHVRVLSKDEIQR
jgi:transcriptional antiterminator NusG